MLQGYDININMLYNNKEGGKNTPQNSKATLTTSTIEFTRHNHDARSRIAKESYYGVIKKIWELKYDSIMTPMFKCKEVDNQRGVTITNDGFTNVDLST